MNRLVLFFAVIIFSSVAAQAQHMVSIDITVLPEQHRNETIYVTGIFNRWAPGDKNYTLTSKGEGKYTVLIQNVPKGLFEYKFTRGDWNTLESTEDGRLVAPRNAIIQNDTTISCVIPAWRDDFPASTASPQVTLIDTAFYLPQLDVYRRIWVYLPKGYEQSKKKYPVLYMHDGQDVFDEATSNGRLGPLEWGVDEVMDAAKNPCIVVAIEHHHDKDGRQREYYIHPNADFPEVYGKQYLEFIVKTLKPFIDKKYRTLPGKQTTWMAGGSMGGLITLYAGLRYPDVFGGLGVMSPSIWQDEGNTLKEISQLKNKKAIQTQHYYFYAGDNENRIKPDGSRVQMHHDVKLAVEQLKLVAGPDIKTTIYPTGRHGAWYWRLAFPSVYEWLSSKVQQ
jgi:predicted alpha/beta superfamily hydrolase